MASYRGTFTLPLAFISVTQVVPPKREKEKGRVAVRVGDVNNLLL
jgi:hypothetical protein